MLTSRSVFAPIYELDHLGSVLQSVADIVKNQQDNADLLEAVQI